MPPWLPQDMAWAPLPMVRLIEAKTENRGIYPINSLNNRLRIRNGLLCFP